MPRSATPTSAPSLLGRILRRLDDVELRSRSAERASRELFREWETHWQKGRTRIVDRLRLIDEHLERSESRPPETISLGLVGVPEDGPRLAPMAG